MLRKAGSRLIGAFVVSLLSGHAQQLPGTINGAAAHITPTVTTLAISGSTVSDVHLRPLYTTTIRLPEAVTSVAVGAPTLFEVEHSDEEPRLVFVKPSTKEPATSNLVIALESGQEISVRLLSDGSAGNTPVDFVVNYQPQQSFLIGSTDSLAERTGAETATRTTEGTACNRPGAATRVGSGDAEMGPWGSQRRQESGCQGAGKADARRTGRSERERGPDVGCLLRPQYYRPLDRSPRHPKSSSTVRISIRGRGRRRKSEASPGRTGAGRGVPIEWQAARTWRTSRRRSILRGPPSSSRRIDYCCS